MPWPDFSELTFGFGFLREFETQFGGVSGFPSAPVFISQNSEAELGYDVEAAFGDGTPVFFQFKRSFVVRYSTATEFKTPAGDLLKPCPVYRMNLRKKNEYQQHKLLQEREAAGSNVLYVTSQVSTPQELNECFVDGTIIDQATAMFSPNEIPCPSDNEQHFVSFRADADHAFLFSDKPTRFDRTLPSPRTLFLEKIRFERSDQKLRREKLLEFNEALMDCSLFARRIAIRFESPLIRASILAMLVLDAHMGIVRDD